MPCCYPDGELSALEDWIAQYEEDAFDAEIAILDPHHHLWDPPNHDKDWPIPKCVIQSLWGLGPKKFSGLLIRVNPMARFCFGERSPFGVYYMAQQLLADQKGNGKGHNVVGTVYLESKWRTPSVAGPLCHYGEVDVAADVNKANPTLCMGIVPTADLRIGVAVEPLLKKYQEHPRVNGIRHLLSWDESDLLLRGDCEKDTMSDPKFREGFALLVKYGLSFDTSLYHHQIGDLAELARAFPEQTIILNHLGYPLGIGKYKREDTFPKWKAAIKDIATCPNVYCKVGGLGSRVCGFGFDERAKPPTSDEAAEMWGPYVLFAIEEFGVDRCMMESNFPVDKVSCSYTVLFNALKKTVRTYSVEDRKKLFELNARKVYKL